MISNTPPHTHTADENYSNHLTDIYRISSQFCFFSTIAYHRYDTKPLFFNGRMVVLQNKNSNRIIKLFELLTYFYRLIKEKVM